MTHFLLLLEFFNLSTLSLETLILLRLMQLTAITLLQFLQTETVLVCDYKTV
jgi:hypothetical protein